MAAILAELDALGLSDNTILVFTSDNGAMEAGSSLPLLRHKHTVYDGGVRLPTVIRWSRGGLVGGRKWGGLCGELDMFPTLMAVTGSTTPPTRPLDGKQIWPALREKRPSPVESYHWVWRDEDAIRTQRWKLHRFHGRHELYDMHSDATEATNVAESHPDLVKSLSARMDARADSMGAAISHRPAPEKYHAEAAPEGEVLAVTVTEASRPSDRLAVAVANWNGTQYATDWIEYDLAFSPHKTGRPPYFSTLEGNTRNPLVRCSGPARPWISSDATRAPAPVSPTVGAYGSTASWGFPAPHQARWGSTAWCSSAETLARSPSISTTSASDMPTAA